MSRERGRRPFRLVVFDWDGTLVDSIGTIIDCTRAVFTELGLEPAPVSTVRGLIGLGLAESIRTLAPNCDEGTLRLAINTYRRLWVEEYHARSSLIDGSREVLARLRAEGYLLAVATAKARRGLDLDLDRLDLGQPFHASRTVDEAPSKPSPAMLLEILDELGVQAGDALMIGDSVHDIQAAHNAGVKALAVTSGAASRETLLACEPLECFATVQELPSWLNGSG